MSEYLHVEKPFLVQLVALGWTVINQTGVQGQALVPADPAASLRSGFREWILPDVFREAVRSLNLTTDGRTWLTDRQLDDLRDQILRQPNGTLLGANEAVQALLFKAQIDVNELTGEADPVVALIDFAHPEPAYRERKEWFRINGAGLDL
ncbi:MAG: type I restriction endonuclease [Gammaproteobacteria bacterium]